MQLPDRSTTKLLLVCCFSGDGPCVLHRCRQATDSPHCLSTHVYQSDIKALSQQRLDLILPYVVMKGTKAHITQR